MRWPWMVILFLGACLPSAAGTPDRAASAATVEPPPAHHHPKRRLMDVRVQNLDLRNASLFDTLRFLADRAHVQLAIDPEVRDRKVTIKIKDLPVLQVLELLLYSEGLDYQLLGADAIRVR
ncbi:STN domain-containing protein [Acanthopleuribacter pedis]|uniref:STN domain-containing protein n=1 Tax=Acanthopleuribacter pedis TaxID=442870 RepID=A0A8J7QGV0_9BACT|nr:STN domain-containing protein [Acanthopleuribacter pedis]MBO1322110.1 STN domain-containing protein [Acanthopleuribacter pedis]